ncbi:MAG: hypothetical protein UT93_C0031G0005 [Candidatus Woesebacteria bacterium GW2011_GWF1_40_24]|uniref:Uncharacterized protein n=1 Tax=Candidatus Woesebacteria bacterium GW2011_GWF1_40_24 TaxID=1618601 RepID=A0A0G0RQQ0_9BACT|nr:MAG: hypothetical protein UT93_C0031G0005 [Candidatus Woesebacteria bacterium GW2011_GWF1_40_24]
MEHQISGLEDGHLVAENHVTVMAEGKFYRSTLIEKTKLSDGSKFRSLMLIENSAGRDKIGDVFVEVRLDPQDGRYKVRIQMEQVFSDENEYELKPRAVRSSVDNSEQALSRRVVDFPGGIRSNPARISGLRIAQHFAHPGWGVNLDQGEFMDIFDYSDSTDAMGHSTLLKALKYYDAEVADEMYKQMRDPDRRKKVD